MAEIAIRDAGHGDVGTLLGFIRDLARYERLEHEVKATAELIEKALFEPSPKTFAFIAEAGGKAVGCAIWFYNFSTFLGRAGIYIEDIYVDPAARGQGAGRALFRHVARRALAEGCGRLEWNVLNWNEPALKFYAGLGAVGMKDWQIQRIAGPALAALAA